MTPIGDKNPTKENLPGLGLWNTEFSIPNLEKMTPIGDKNPTKENLPGLGLWNTEFSIPNLEKMTPIGDKSPTEENLVPSLGGLLPEALTPILYLLPMRKCYADYQYPTKKRVCHGPTRCH
ncbi:MULTISPECIES: hypothetical protein [unclassified Microcoleus]|uniref:hypothetical protein n=1 Tax=unclassified Microcoleus TaxID=2642155 RepID=UPI002FD5AC92